MSLYLIIFEGISMIFVTGLLVYHYKLIVRNMTTKEEIKSYFENPTGNPFNRNNKYINMKNSLFPLKQTKSILNIFKQGFYKISYYLGVLNANGIITEEETQKIGDQIANSFFGDEQIAAHHNSFPNS